MKYSNETDDVLTTQVSRATNTANWPNATVTAVDQLNKINNQFVHQMMTNGTTSGLAGAFIEKAAKEIVIKIREVENGRVMSMGDKVYIIGPDESLVDTIRVALVNAKLE